MKITYYGHACFMIEGSKKILIDPFITGNPLANVKPSDLKPDILLITHGHGDHLGDAVDIAKNSKPIVACIYEISLFLGKHGVSCEPMNIGGSISVDGVKITMVPALHSSSVEGSFSSDACGFVVEIDNKTIYHAGDTALFRDMKTIGELFEIDVAMLPIGDRFTMDAKQAAIAVKWLKAKKVIPMHYATFPIIEKSPEKFVEEVKKVSDAEVLIVKPNESIEI